jgi:hypothetical protein
MIETAARTTPAPRGQRAVVKRYGADCAKRFVGALGIELPTEMANRFERHLRSKTRAGRLILALEAEQQ